MKGRVIGVYLARGAAEAMQPVETATLEAGRGLVGDRYHIEAGTFSEKLAGKPDVQITLIEVEEVERFNAREGLEIQPADLRRNIVTRGVRLNPLVGVRFRVGPALLDGIRLCEPCSHLAKVVHPGVLPGLVHRAGLRARIISGGIVRSQDEIALEPVSNVP